MQIFTGKFKKLKKRMRNTMLSENTFQKNAEKREQAGKKWNTKKHLRQAQNRILNHWKADYKISLYENKKVQKYGEVRSTKEMINFDNRTH